MTQNKEGSTKAPTRHPVEFNNPDFAMLAESFGAWGKVVSSTDEFKSALEEAFEQNGPALIGVPIDYAENMKLILLLQRNVNGLRFILKRIYQFVLVGFMDK